MTLYAFEVLDDAFEATKALLWPFDRGTWFRLAVVVFFVGGAGGFNPIQFPGGNTGNVADAPAGPGPSPPDALPSLGGAELGLILGLVGLLVLLGLGFMFVGAVMEFVFVESLRREEVAVRDYWRRHWGRGVRLFGFRLLVGVVTLAVVVSLLVVTVGPAILGGNPLFFGLLLVAIPLFVAVSILSGLVNGFTTMFVVPIMLTTETGLLASWRRFWPTLTGQWKQYAAYAVVGFVLQLAGGLLAGLVTLVGALVVAIPLVVVGLVGAALLVVSDVAGFVVVGLAVVAFVIAVVVIWLFASVPVQTFLRYYALFVLGDTNDDFDVIADRRRAVRDETGSAA